MLLEITRHVRCCGPIAILYFLMRIKYIIYHGKCVLSYKSDNILLFYLVHETVVPIEV